MAFKNAAPIPDPPPQPINPATEQLLFTGIRSSNYSPGVSGWRIGQDGDAEFAGIVDSEGQLIGRDGIQSDDYQPGTAGRGWRLDTGVDDGVHATQYSRVITDDVILRGRLQSYNPDSTPGDETIQPWVYRLDSERVRTTAIEMVGLMGDDPNTGTPEYGWELVAYAPNAAELGFPSFNDFVNPGRWEFRSNGAAAAMADNPVGLSGILYVDGRRDQTRVTQWYIVYTAPGSFASHNMYHRCSVDTGFSWTPWQKIQSGDSGWVPWNINAAYAEHSSRTPEVRRVGDNVYLRGGISNTGLSTNGTYTIGSLPAGFRPVGQGHYGPVETGSTTITARFAISTTGAISIVTSGTVSALNAIYSSFVI